MVEYPTKVPTPPQELRWDGQSLYFEPPKWDGGGRILEYKVWTILVIRQRSLVFGMYSSMFSIQLIYKVQLKPIDGQHFVVFKVVPVLYLSDWPKLEDNFFGDLGGEYIASFIHYIYRKSLNISTGKFILRVVARNHSRHHSC